MGLYDTIKGLADGSKKLALGGGSISSQIEKLGSIDSGVNLYKPITGGSSVAGNTGKGGFLKSLNPAMKFDLALAGVDLLGSLGMGLQSAFAKKPKVYRTAAPTLETPQINDNVAAEQAMVEENLGEQTNTILNNAMETGQDISSMTGIFANANKAYREEAARLSGVKRDISNQKNMIIAETENKNKMLQYENEREFAAREADVLSKDAMMRGQQMSAAVSNVGAIGSRLLNDYMLTDIIQKGNMADSQSDRYAAGTSIVNRIFSRYGRK